MMRGTFSWMLCVIASVSVVGVADGIVAVAAFEQPSAGQGKLSPELAAAADAGATFLGMTVDGEAVLDFPPPLELSEASEALAGRPDVRASHFTERIPHASRASLVVFHASGGDLIASVAPQARAVEYEAGGFTVLSYPHGVSSGEVVALSQSPAVAYVEPTYFYELAETRPDDPFIERKVLWNLERVNAQRAWARVTDSKSIVAVIDTGVDYRHEDLAGNIWVNPAEIAGNRIDDDRNGFIDDVHGIDLADGDGDPMDQSSTSHGTHVAGTIAAIGNNRKGGAGIVWHAPIMGLRIFGAQDLPATQDRIAMAIDYAVDHGASVINASWGGPRDSRALREAIERAGNKGVIVVAAAGNQGHDIDRVKSYPAVYEFDNVITVVATDDSDAVARFASGASNYGARAADLGAPGVRIRSTIRGGAYADKEGSSMAAPLVTGAVALAWNHPALAGAPARRVRRALLDHAAPLPGLRGKCATGGRLDVSFLAEREVASVPAARYQGSLETPVFAIGAETTGVILDSASGQIEVDLTRVREAERRIESLRGQEVTVEGVMERIESPERGVRSILRANEIRAFSPSLDGKTGIAD